MQLNYNADRRICQGGISKKVGLMLLLRSCAGGISKDGKPACRGAGDFHPCWKVRLCNTHGITQGMYYKWCDRLLTDGAELFECGGVDHARERLKQENRKLRKSSKNA